MTADDLLFEPLNLPTKGVATPVGNSATGSNGNGIIVVPNNYTRVDIQSACPKQLYTDAAGAVIDHAVVLHPTMTDVRKPLGPLPPGFMSLVDIVARFHTGWNTMWVAQPRIMPPTQFIFEGRFGHFKFQRMPQQFIPGQNFIWFWIDTTAGQLAAIDLGLLCVHQKLKAYHAFNNENDALNYFRS